MFTASWPCAENLGYLETARPYLPSRSLPCFPLAALAAHKNRISLVKKGRDLGF